MEQLQRLYNQMRPDIGTAGPFYLYPEGEGCLNPVERPSRPAA